MQEFACKMNCYPLSNSQLNIWALEQSFHGTSMNNICETIRIRGTFDIALLQECLNLVLQSDSSLRIQITLNDNHIPMQYEQEYREQQFPVFDFSATNQTGIQHWESSITKEVMPVLNAPLFYFAILKIGEHEGGVLIKTHHLISDGWSQVALINRIAQTYLALLNGEAVTLDPTPSYRLHVEEEAKYHSSKTYLRDKKFWEETLQDLPQPVSLKEYNNAELSPVGLRKTFLLSDTLNHALTAFCTSRRVAPFAVFYMAIAIYLKRVKNIGKLCIGSPIHNRSNVTDRQTTGMFVSTLPFFSSLDENWSFEEFNEHLAENWLDLLRHQRFPFSEITSIAKEHNPDLNRLFHLVLSFHNSKAYRNRDTSIVLSGQWHYAGYQAEHLCIHLNNIEDERRYSVNYDYLTQLFSKYDIEDFHHYLINILTQALSFPSLPIYKLSILGAEEEEKVLYSFNRTEAFCYSGNLSQKLDEIYQAFGSRAAVIEEGKRYSYHMLSQKAGAVSEALFRLFPDGKEIIALFLPKSYQLLASLAGAVRSGNAFVILSPSLPEKRIEQILSDSGASVILTSASHSEQLPSSEAPVIDIDTLPEKSNRPLPECPAKPNDLAYLVYTSGSTGVPKGVEIEQQSLLNFAESMRPFYGKGAVLSLCNISFDAFLLESIVSLLNGQTIVLPTEEAQEDPAQIAALIQSYGVGFLAVTPSRLTAYLKNTDFFRAANRLESIICGGEAFPSSLLKNLSRCTGARIYNQYGPSEATIGVSTSLLNAVPVISVGAPMRNCRCYILDKHLKPLPIGVYGDLYIGGLCVGRGYHNAPELTDKAFLPSPFEPEERIYRTGDLAAWTENGELILKGREDGQVKLRGQRIELDEIASCLMQHPAIRQAVVRLLNVDGQSMLVAYYVAGQFVTESELLEFSATYLPGYMIPAIFQSIPSVPLTPNGKVDYARLPFPMIQKSYTGQTPASAAAQTVLSVFQNVLKRADLSASDDYFLCGGDSLNALETLSELESVFGVRLRVADLYACRTALRLATRLEGAGEPEPSYAEIQKSAPLEVYPLTPAQLGIYFETQMSPDSTSYNMPCGFHVAGPIDPMRLEAAVQKLIDLEPLFRAAFLPQKDGIGQKVCEICRADFTLYRDIPLEEAKEAFIRPFDLSRPPLLRAALWQSGQDEAVIMVDLHHIAGDAVTAAATLQHLDMLYRGETLSLPNITYLDYAQWLKENSARLSGEERGYWQEQMQNAPSLPDIPTDFPRPKQFDYTGTELSFSLSESESLSCEQYCEQRGLTPYMFFAAAFGVFLSKLSGSKDFFVGTPVSSRRYPSVSETAGLFVNTLPLRLTPKEGLTLADYLAAVKDTIVGLLDHPFFPLDEIVTLSGAERVQGQNPLYNTIISMRPVEVDGFTFAGQTAAPEPVPAKSAKVDLNLEVAKSGGCYQFRLEYADHLFAADTVSLYSRSLITIVREILRDDSCLLENLSAVSAPDRYRLFERPSHYHLPYSDLPIDRQVDAMAEMLPDSPAFIFHDEVMTFSELKARSDALAALLLEQGIGPRDAVGLLCRRGPELPVAMMAVLKTGAAYVPMLPNFPENRLHYMVEISGVTLTLCDQKTMENLPQELPCRFMEINPSYESPRAFQPPEGRDIDDTCFILFTSGSTGNPKGVMIRHRSICNLIAVLDPILSSIDGGFLCTANSIFDIFTTETLIAMAYGKYSVMADEEEMMLPWNVAELITKHRVGMIEFTPSRAQLFLNNHVFFEAIQSMPVAMMCGEVLPPQLLQMLRDAKCQRIFNLYGPTEVTVYCTMDEVTHADRITVGRMYPNCRGYVLDEAMRPVMPTASGELYFSGDCVANGYVGRKDLTKEMFLPDPFFPGATMYRSGDIVRLLPDGRIDFLGRRDHQVKLNGQRIELSEITQKILDSGYAAHAATIVKKDGSFMVLASFVEGKPGCSFDAAALRGYLKKELPAYMVPSEIHLLSALPCTASGKLDLKKLENWAPEQPETTDTPPASVPESIPTETPQGHTDNKTVFPAPEMPENSSLESLWAEVLSKEQIDPQISFFEQGGTSLAALTLLSSYFNQGLSMTLAEFYEHPTLQAQLSFFGLKEETQAKMAEITLQAAEPPAISPKTDIQPQVITAFSKEAVFLTGGTGFFGSHLIRALLDEGYPKLFALVRGENPARLYETLAWYFGSGWLKSNRAKIVPIQGDLLQPGFGIPDTLSEELSKQISYVIHAAADVRHYASDGLAELTNRGGTANAISFARRAQAKLIHISTISLGGEYLLGSPKTVRDFTEQDFEIGQNWRDNVYLRGKYAAEQLVREAAQNGLSAVILRIGRLVGRSSDGVFQKNASTNAFWGLVSGICCLSKISTDLAQLPLEMTAVDECARAAVLLMQSCGPVYHLFNPQVLPIREILAQLGKSLQEVDRETFEQHLKERSRSADGVKIAPLLSQYYRLMQVPFRITPVCTLTEQALAAHQFYWKKPDPRKLLQSFFEDE